MATLYLAANHISGTSLVFGQDYGHLQVVFEDGGDFTELEVSAPPFFWTGIFGGDWIYDLPQEHFGDNTPGTNIKYSKTKSKLIYILRLKSNGRIFS